MTTNSLGYKLSKNPIAQSFFIDELAGIYITKVDVYFAAKDTNFAVGLQIRPMENGTPSSSVIIPGSQVVVAGASVNTSTDATSATTFTFAEPVYLKGLTEYALVLTADSPDYKVYVAQINEFLLGSTEKRVDRQPVLGSLFYSQNGSTFTPIQDQDLTFKLYQAKFRDTSGEVRLYNAAVPKKLLRSNPIKVTSSSSSVRVLHINSGLQVGETVNISGVDSAGVGGISYASLVGDRTVTSVDWTGFRFTADSAADSDVIGGGSGVLTTKNIPYSVIYPSIQTLVPTGTGFVTGMKYTTGKSYAGTETAFQKSSTFSNIQINQNSYGPIPYLVVNEASETAELGSGVKSLEFAIEVGTIDSNVTPMIDMQRTSATLIGNLIDRQDSAASSGFNVPINFVDETTATGGSSASKYIMKKITLEEDAVGLKIILSANRPSTSDFIVYYRVGTGDEVLSDKSWIALSEETNNPSDEIETVFREYRYLAGGQAGNLDAFTQFQIKIVMRSTNEAKVARFKDLRVIALSV